MRNRKLGRTTAQRKAMLRGMVTLLLENGKIETTYTRAKEIAAVADSMITLAKVKDKSEELAAYRKALTAFASYCCTGVATDGVDSVDSCIEYMQKLFDEEYKLNNL